jgi:uncharacterized protein YcsI (UPF0317 family)
MRAMLSARPFAIDADAAQRGAAQRRRARDGFGGTTCGTDAIDLVQGNLVVLPASDAHDFLLYCQRNPRPCPLLAVAEGGAFDVPQLGHGIDLRSDLPRYRVWRHGELVDEPADVRALWRDDFVSFVIGCSFSFEWALLADGIALRHVTQGRNVSMYRTSLPTAPAGRFAGPLVVTMRPLKAADAIRAVQITSRFPAVHGAPVHLGDPGLIGIHDLATPDYGDAVDVMRDEIPVFWACGVTPQAALAAARPALCITHAPGSMLVTDLRNHQMATL